MDAATRPARRCPLTTGSSFFHRSSEPAHDDRRFVVIVHRPPHSSVDPARTPDPAPGSRPRRALRHDTPIRGSAAPERSRNSVRPPSPTQAPPFQAADDGGIWLRWCSTPRSTANRWRAPAARALQPDPDCPGRTRSPRGYGRRGSSRARRAAPAGGVSLPRRTARGERARAPA